MVRLSELSYGKIEQFLRRLSNAGLDARTVDKLLSDNALCKEWVAVLLDKLLPTGLNGIFDPPSGGTFVPWKRVTLDWDDLLHLEVDSMPIPERSLRVLRQARLDEIGDLIRLTPTALRSLSFLGPKSVSEVQKALAMVNLRLVEVEDVPSSEWVSDPFGNADRRLPKAMLLDLPVHTLSELCYFGGTASGAATHLGLKYLGDFIQVDEARLIEAFTQALVDWEMERFGKEVSLVAAEARETYEDFKDDLKRCGVGLDLSVPDFNN